MSISLQPASFQFFSLEQLACRSLSAGRETDNTSDSDLRMVFQFLKNERKHAGHGEDADEVVFYSSVDDVFHVLAGGICTYGTDIDQTCDFPGGNDRIVSAHDYKLV